MTFMLHGIEESLKRLGFKFNPFKDLSPDDPNFDKLFINRKKELYKMEMALEFYSGGGKKNVVLIGEPRIGKTTFLNYVYRDITKYMKCVKFRFILRFIEFTRELFKLLEENNSLEDSLDKGDITLRDLGNRLIQLSERYKSKAVIMIDNFEEFLNIKEDEREEYIRIFKRSDFMFIIACIRDEWYKILDVYPALRSVFSEDILLEPFKLKHTFELINSRVEVASESGKNPFTDEAIRLIGIYSFFIPGRIVDLANKVIFECIAEEADIIDEELVKKVIFESPTLSKFLEDLSDKEIQVIEIMVEIGEPVGFEELSKKMNVSRVTVAEYIQKLIKKGIVEHLETTGKKKYFKLKESFKQLLV